jgi:hypothetical protein
MAKKAVKTGNNINKDVLTLVRELALLREENLKLREENILLNLCRKKLKAYRSLMYQVVKFLCWLSNNYNSKIQNSAITLLDEHKKMQEDLQEKPFNYYGYYSIKDKKIEEAENLTE